MTPGTQSVDLQERGQLGNAGFVPCDNPSCSWMHAPGQAEQACPSCGADGAEPSLFNPGGWTRAGISMREQGALGEQILRGLGEISGYGPITWWADHYNSPLDAATREWGIEVKTANVDGAAQQFNLGPDERITKNAAAAEAGYKGILGVLVILDYRRSVADIYVKEFTLAPWKGNNGRWYEGVGFYRKNSDYHLVKETPFTNPFMNPQHPAPDMPF